MVPSQHRCNY
jgi:hypothetical protein